MPAASKTFGRPRPGLRTIRRRQLRLRDARPAIDAAATAPDPAVLADPAAANARADIAEIQRRFTICKTCQHARDNAFACELFKGCCFGRFRSGLVSNCPAGKWTTPSASGPRLSAADPST
ncbi:MAG: hypothetical protein ACOC8H_01460 [bacterium]